MFKGRSNKIEFNGSQPPVSTNIKAYASNIKRHSSMRQHHSSNFNLEAKVENGNSSYTNHKFLSSKKYVSCENVRQRDDEFQEVSCDEDDENGIKEKLMKRYNSLTTLLMKSFRKAKSKKKKCDLQLSHLETNFEEEGLPEMICQSVKTSSHISTNCRSEFEPNRNLLKNSSRFNGVARSGSLASSSFSRSLASGSISRADSDTLNDIQSKKSNASLDKSTPVFKGVKIISNDFVDIKPQSKASLVNTPLEQHDTSINLSSQNKKGNQINTKTIKDIKTVQPNFSIDSSNSRNEANEIYNKLTKILGDSSSTSFNAAYKKANYSNDNSKTNANDSLTSNKINFSTALMKTARSINELEKTSTNNTQQINNISNHVNKRNTLSNTQESRPVEMDCKKISLSNENFLETLTKETENHKKHRTLEKLIDTKNSVSISYQSNDKIAYNFNSLSKPQAPKIPSQKSAIQRNIFSESQNGPNSGSLIDKNSNEIKSNDNFSRNSFKQNGLEFNKKKYQNEENIQKIKENNDIINNNNQSLYTTIKGEIEPQTSYSSLNLNTRDNFFDNYAEITLNNNNHNSRNKKFHLESQFSLSRDKCKSLTRDYKDKNISINNLTDISGQSQLIKILNLEDKQRNDQNNFKDKFSLPAFVLNSSEEGLNQKEIMVEKSNISKNISLGSVKPNSFLYHDVDNFVLINDNDNKFKNDSNENTLNYNDDKTNFPNKKDTNSFQNSNGSQSFTQQLQEILKERKAPSLTRINNLESVIEKNNYENKNKIESPNLIDNTLSEIFDYQYRNSPPVLSTSSPNPFLKNNQFEKNYDYIKNSLLDLNKIEPTTSLETTDYENDSRKNSLGSNSDDFKDLVSVLTRQDQDFKKKFFDCLMPKLWDTKLPYSEYIQLNKLMTALFGESYHKLDLISNLSSKQNANRPDAEQIVNLMKAYLDTSAPSTPSIHSKSINLKEDLNDLNNFKDLNDYLSVGNLINTLKRRKNDESLLIKKIEDDQEFINGFNKNNIYNNLQINRISPIENSSPPKSLDHGSNFYNTDKCEKSNDSELSSTFTNDLSNNLKSEAIRLSIGDCENGYEKNLENGLDLRQIKTNTSKLIRLQQKNSNIKVYSNQMPNVVKQIINENYQIHTQNEKLNWKLQNETKKEASVKIKDNKNYPTQASSFQPSTSLIQSNKIENSWITAIENKNNNNNNESLKSFNKHTISFDLEKEKLNQDYIEIQKNIYMEHQRKCQEAKKNLDDQQKIEQFQLMDKLIQQKKYKETLLLSQHKEQKLRETQIKEQILRQNFYEETQLKELLSQNKIQPEQKLINQTKLFQENQAKSQQIKEKIIQQKIYEEQQEREKQIKNQLAQIFYHEHQNKEYKMKEQKLLHENNVKEQQIKDQLAQKLLKEKKLKDFLVQKFYQDNKFKEQQLKQKQYQDNLISEKNQPNYQYNGDQQIENQQKNQHQNHIKDRMIEKFNNKDFFNERLYQKHFEMALAQQNQTKNFQFDVEYIDNKTLSKLIEKKENEKKIIAPNINSYNKKVNLSCKTTILNEKNNNYNLKQNSLPSQIKNSSSPVRYIPTNNSKVSNLTEDVQKNVSSNVFQRTQYCQNDFHEKNYEADSFGSSSLNKNSCNSTIKSNVSTQIQSKSKPNYNQLNELFSHKAYKLDEQSMQQAYY